MVGEGVGVGALSVEFFLGEGGAGVGFVGFAVFFALLALGWGRHCGGVEGLLAEKQAVGQFDGHTCNMDGAVGGIEAALIDKKRQEFGKA